MHNKRRFRRAADPPDNSAPSLSFWDNLRYNVLHVLPYYTRGVTTRNRFWVAFWARVHPDPMGVRFFSALRKKYRSDYLYLLQIATKSLVVLDPDGIKRVLDHSPDIYAEPRLKHKTMSHFQPGAVTISRGKAWQERRRFNEAVLHSGETLHPYAGHFLAVIRREVAASRGGGGPAGGGGGGGGPPARGRGGGGVGGGARSTRPRCRPRSRPAGRPSGRVWSGRTLPTYSSGSRCRLSSARGTTMSR